MNLKILMISACVLCLHPHGPANAGGPKPVKVHAKLETTPVPSAGDAADDPAVWVHPKDRNRSLLLGTDKRAGLAVYDLSGKQIQFLAVGNLNNIDVRYDFALGKTTIDIVVGGNRSDQSLDVYTIDPDTLQVTDVSAGKLPLGLDEAYGCTLYRSRTTGKTFAFVNDQRGEVEQYELTDVGGRVGATLVRKLSVGSQTEGMVADDRHGLLYVGEEKVGIWRYDAEPGGSSARVRVDRADRKSGHLTADVEGLAIYHGPGGSGYLIASSQGNDRFVIYDRQGTNEYIGTFRIVKGPNTDSVQDTDGLEVMSAALGDAFPNGLFIAQDGIHKGEHQNFKVVSWPEIAKAMTPPLIVDPTWNPRETPPPVSAATKHAGREAE